MRDADGGFRYSWVGRSEGGRGVGLVVGIGGRVAIVCVDEI